MLALLPVLLVILTPAGTANATGRILVSTDGVTWSTALDQPLFTPGERWVPGDVRSASFFVANHSADAGTLTLAAHARDLGGLLARGDVALEVRRGSSGWNTVAADGAPHRLGTAVLAAGAEDRITVRATFRAASANISQSRQLLFDFQVLLSQVIPVAAPGEDGGGGGGPGLLPDTGGFERWVLLAGIALVVAGTTVLRNARSSTLRKDDS
ncbi:hypothetical protein [Marmoricola sp. RAF53]|uniref:hypothetical protein n=1 Tax=Marmoricola sp. RAF53 TaxID=3233059 RepID=UPI003F9EAA66